MRNQPAQTARHRSHPKPLRLPHMMYFLNITSTEESSPGFRWKNGFKVAWFEKQLKKIIDCIINLSISERHLKTTSLKDFETISKFNNPRLFQAHNIPQNTKEKRNAKLSENFRKGPWGQDCKARRACRAWSKGPDYFVWAQQPGPPNVLGSWQQSCKTLHTATWYCCSARKKRKMCVYIYVLKLAFSVWGPCAKNQGTHIIHDVACGFRATLYL